MLGKIVSNLSWQVLERGLRLIVNLTVGILVVRYLGPEQFGVLSTGLALLGFGYAFANMNLRPVTIRRLLENPEDEPRILGSAALLLSVSSFLAGLCLFAGAFIAPIEPALKWVIVLLTVQFIFMPLHEPQLFRFQARLEEKYTVIAQAVALGIASVVRVVMIFAGFSLTWFAAVFTLETIIRVAIVWRCFHRSGGRLRKLRPDLSETTSLFRETAPLMIALVAATFYHQLDTVMLKAMAGSASAGIYSAAARLSEVFYFVPFVLGSSLLPSIFNARRRNPDLYRARLTSYLKLSAALAYGLSIAMTLIGPWAVRSLYGAEFKDAGAVLMIHAWAAIPFFLGHARNEFFTAERLFKLVMPVTIIGAITNGALNLWMIPRWAETGAAVATLISYTVAYLLTSFLFKPAREIGRLQLGALLNPIPSLRNLSAAEKE